MDAFFSTHNAALAHFASCACWMLCVDNLFSEGLFVNTKYYDGGTFGIIRFASYFFKSFFCLVLNFIFRKWCFNVVTDMEINF